MSLRPLSHWRCCWPLALILTLVWLSGLQTSVLGASLLPNGEQTFLDANGSPLAGGSVTFLIPNTATLKTTWKDPLQTILNANPVALDSAGRAVIYGSGQYTQIVKDVNGIVQWTQLTADPNAISWGGTSSGTANAQVLTIGNFTATGGQQIGFIAGLTNTTALTLTAGGQAAVQVYKDLLTGTVPLTGGEVRAGNLEVVFYDSNLGVFHLVSLPPQNSFPGNVAIQGNLGVVGSTSLNSLVTAGLATLGAGATVVGNLSVSLQTELFGVVTLHAAVTTLGPLTVGTGLTVTGAATVGTTLGVAGVTTTGGATATAPYATAGSISLPTGVGVSAANTISARANFTTTTVNNGWNVASVASGGVGIYNVTFAVAMASANYSVTVNVNGACAASAIIPVVGAKSTSGFTITTDNTASSPVSCTGTPIDFMVSGGL